MLGLGKKPKAPAIANRIEQLNGMTYEQALKLKIPSNKPPGWRYYNQADYWYDIKTG